MSTRFTVKEFSQETWPDFESLFGKHKGARGGCWCTYNLCTKEGFKTVARVGKVTLLMRLILK